MPRISVIVPVYNVESYLASCLASVRRQDLSDIEIVCVNDGSPDCSSAILELFARADSRIVVVDKPNGGLSSARNAGIKAASGEYVCFLDSDDLLEKNACSTIVAAFDRTGADVVTYGASAYPELMTYGWLENVLSPRDVVFDGFSLDLLFKESSCPFVWRTACKRSFLEESQVLFDETLPYGEDQVFQFAVYPRSRRTALISDKLVLYRVSREGSFMHSRLRDQERMAKDHVEIVSRIVTDWKQLGLLDRCPTEAMDWIVQFCLLRILQLDEDKRHAVLQSFAAVIGAAFEESFLRKYASSGPAGALVNAALFDHSYATGNRRRKAVYRYLASVDGRGATAKLLFSEILSRGVLGRVRRGVGGRLPVSSRAMNRQNAMMAWEQQDRFDRAQALALVKLEAARQESR